MFSGVEEGRVDESSLSPEQLSQRKCDEIVRLLLAAGYFRARISGLANFDKVIGGLAWALAASNVDVDVDVFFEENLTIGQRCVKLSEQCINALRRMRCPHPLQAHQIQGGDYVNLFPVIQWLVKKVIETREETGDVVRRFSEAQFHHHYKLPSDVVFKDNLKAALPFVHNVHVIYKPQRHFRRAKQIPLTTESAHVDSVLLEYGSHRLVGYKSGTGPAGDAKRTASSRRISVPTRTTSLSTLGEGETGVAALRKGKVMTPEEETAAREQAKKEEEERIRVLMEKMSAVGFEETEISSVAQFLQGAETETIRKMEEDMDEQYRLMAEQRIALEEGGDVCFSISGAGGAAAYNRQVTQMEKQIDVHKRKLREAQAKFDAVAADMEARHADLAKVIAYNERAVRETNKLKAMETPENEQQLARLRQLVGLNEGLKAQEAEFRLSCKQQMADLRRKAEGLESTLPEEELERLQKIEDLYNADLAKLQKIREVLATKNQEASAIQRKIDEVPTRNELIQYEKRFVELYEQVSGKLEETRKYYLVYNTLDDSKAFHTKEVSLLNSIYENYASSMKTRTGARAMITQMEQICAQVQRNLEKVAHRVKDSKSKLYELTESYNKLTELQRNYFKAVKEFQEECGRNEFLLAEKEKQRRRA